MYGATSYRDHAFPSEISSNMSSSLFEISTLMVGEIFDMFPSLNASSSRMGF